MNQINERLQDRQIALVASPEAVDWMAENGYDPVYGARPIHRLIKHKILNQLSRMILGK